MALARCTCRLVSRQTLLGTLTQASSAAQSAGASRQRRAKTTAASGPSIEHKLATLARQTLSRAAADAANISDIEAAKRTKQLEGLREALRSWDEAEKEMRDMAANDLESAKEDLDAASERLQAALLPPDATAALGCLLEIKAGVGGSEASIFAGDLMRMYTRFAAGRGWKSELVNASAVSASTGSAGGSDAFREVIVEIDGQGAYQALRYEAGVHRVQRVPATESQGRVHTSTASVVVLPSGSDSDPSIEDVLDEKDVKVEVMRSGGAGGQHVNRTESAVRLTHSPTGITVSMQDTRSQHKNRQKAFQVLRARLLALQVAEAQEQSRAKRRAQVRGTDRSEKIRTYNFSQDRVTDHRLPLTLSGVEDFLEGDGGTLDIMISELDQWSVREQIEDLLAESEAA